VRSPILYLADSGFLQTSLHIDSPKTLGVSPVTGASCEGFMHETVVSLMQSCADQCYFWTTKVGAERDLFVVNGALRLGFEFKRPAMPTVAPSMRIGMANLDLNRLDVVHAGDDSFRLASRIHAVSAMNELAHLIASNPKRVLARLADSHAPPRA
jgi:predicted AAA+ superfamily ATPase